MILQTLRAYHLDLLDFLPLKSLNPIVHMIKPVFIFWSSLWPSKDIEDGISVFLPIIWVSPDRSSKNIHRSWY